MSRQLTVVKQDHIIVLKAVVLSRQAGTVTRILQQAQKMVTSRCHRHVVVNDPWEEGYNPVKAETREGTQSGNDAMAFSKRTPSLANDSRFGV